MVQVTDIWGEPVYDAWGNPVYTEYDPYTNEYGLWNDDKTGQQAARYSNDWNDPYTYQYAQQAPAQ